MLQNCGVGLQNAPGSVPERTDRMTGKETVILNGALHRSEFYNLYLMIGCDPPRSNTMCVIVSYLLFALIFVLLDAMSCRSSERYIDRQVPQMNVSICRHKSVVHQIKLTAEVIASVNK